MLYIVYAIHVLICLFLIMVVLLQQGSGADLSVFGGGGTQTAFGARSATNLLHKLTVGAFVGFILTTIAIGFIKTGGGSSVMTEVEQSVGEGAEAAEDAPASEASPAPENAVPEPTGEAPAETGAEATSDQDAADPTNEESGGS